MTKAISVLRNLNNIRVNLYPYPHIVIENALPSEYFDSLEKVFLTLEDVAGRPPYKNNHAYIKSYRDLKQMDLDAVWKDFIEFHTSKDFYSEVLKIFGSTILNEYPEIEHKYGRPLSDFTVSVREVGNHKNRNAKSTDIKMDIQVVVNTPVFAKTSVRSEHIDSKYKLFAGILYFRSSNDNSTGGNLELCDIDPSNATFNLKTFQMNSGEIKNKIVVPYKANTFVMWINSSRSVHGVSQRDITNCHRKYVNFLCESYKYRSGFFSPRADVNLLNSIQSITAKILKFFKGLRKLKWVKAQ